ncbi:MAG TPA: hypothetical protein VIK78_16725 [Ruminiclostridium sp.]
MKFLSKINRGLILMSVVLIAVAIYLMAQSMSQAEAKPKIKDVCQQYIDTAIIYKQLPEKYKKENPEIPQAELDKYIDDMTKALKAFYTPNEQTYKYEIERYKANLESQAKGEGVVFSYKKDIAEYKNFIFEGNTVTVTILTNSVLDGPNISLPGTPRESIATQTTDTITLQKNAGEWKIIYADLPEPMKQGAIESQMYK